MKNFQFSIFNFQFQNGQSLVELLLVIGLSSVVLPVLLLGFISSREGKAQQGQRSMAVALLRETIEAVRSVRESGWDNFESNGTYHPEIDSIGGSSWILVGNGDTVGNLSREVVISDAERDASGAIVASGTIDTSTKKVKVTISWGSPPFDSTVESTLYLTRYLDNNSFTETTELEFTSGTITDTEVTNISGGEIVLGPGGGGGDWCAPDLSSIQEFDLPKSGVANALTAIEGKAFVGTGENASGVSFAKLEITDTNPPAISMPATFDGYKTNDVFGETDYVYIATDNGAKEVVIIDLNDIVAGEYQEEGFFDVPGAKKAESVFVANNVGYVTTSDSKLYSFDLSSKSGQRPLADPDGISLAGTGTRVVVVNNYAYVSLTDPHPELQIVDVTNPYSLTSAGETDIDTANQSSTEEGEDVFVSQDGTRAYLVTNIEPVIEEFFIIDTTTKTGNRPVIGAYETGNMSPKGVTVIGQDKKAIVVGQGGVEYQVIDISTESNPTACGPGLNMDSGINGVSSVIEADGDAYSYIITGDSSTEFKIIEGGSGGGTYLLSGTFESSTFDAGFSTGFNRFDVSLDRPADTNIEFQVAVKPGVSGSCSGVSFASSDFVGPSGTSSDYFTTSVTFGAQFFDFAVPFNINPGQCFRYKAYLSTTDSAVTPIFDEITVNYSP